MRIALVGADVEDNLGLGMVAAALGAARHRVEVVPYNDLDQLDAVLAERRARRPGLIGLGMQFQHRARDFLMLARGLRAEGFRGHLARAGSTRRSRPTSSSGTRRRSTRWCSTTGKPPWWSCSARSSGENRWTRSPASSSAAVTARRSGRRRGRCTRISTRCPSRGALGGSHLGWDYRIADDRAELLYRIAAASLHERNFDAGGVANRTMGLGYMTQVLATFYEASAPRGRRLLARGAELVQRVTLDTASHLEAAIALAAGAELGDRDRIERETARLALRVAAHARQWHAALDDLIEGLLAFTEEQREEAARRARIRSLRGAVGGVAVVGAMSLGAQACGGRATHDDGDPGPSADAGAGGAGEEGGAGGFVQLGGAGGTVDPLPFGGSGGYAYDMLPTGAFGGMIDDSTPSGGGLGGTVDDPWPDGGTGGFVSDALPAGGFGIGGSDRAGGSGGFVSDDLPAGGRGGSQGDTIPLGGFGGFVSDRVPADGGTAGHGGEPVAGAGGLAGASGAGGGAVATLRAKQVWA